MPAARRGSGARGSDPPQRWSNPSTRVAVGSRRAKLALRWAGAKRRQGGGSIRAMCSRMHPPPDSALACAHAEPPSPPLASLAGGRDRERANAGVRERREFHFMILNELRAAAI